MQLLFFLGNSFGESGCDKLQEIMTKANKSDVLHPFDNDENDEDTSNAEVKIL